MERTREENNDREFEGKTQARRGEIRDKERK